MELSLRLGIPHQELLQRMDSAELSEYLALLGLRASEQIESEIDRMLLITARAGAQSARDTLRRANAARSMRGK